jgi:hypothetical protein
MFRAVGRCGLLAAIVMILLLGGATASLSAWEIGTPIVTLYGSGHLGGLDDTRADFLVNCGYNVAWISDVGSELTVAENHNLRTMLMSGLIWPPSSLTDPVKRPLLDAMVDTYKASPSAGLYWVMDEPGVAQFPEYQLMVEYLRERDPAHASYINLFPNVATGEQLMDRDVSGAYGSCTYDYYLNAFQDAYQPDLLSYDNYQFMASSDDSHYLGNLDIVNKFSRQTGTPFMNTVQVCKWASWWRTPSANEVRYLTYTTLAYGAQGIAHWCYFSDTGGDGGLKDNPTLCSAMGPINREFVAIAEELQAAQSLGGYLRGYKTQSGVYKGPPDTATLPADSAFQINVNNTMTYYNGAAVKGVLLGLFGDDGAVSVDDATYCMVTNLDYGFGHNYTLTGPVGSILQIYDPATDTWASTGGNTAALSLVAGGGKLVRVTPVPEPGVWMLCLTALLTGAVWSARKNNKKTNRS